VIDSSKHSYTSRNFKAFCEVEIVGFIIEKEDEEDPILPFYHKIMISYYLSICNFSFTYILLL